MGGDLDADVGAVEAEGRYREVSRTNPGRIGHGEAQLAKNPWSVAKSVSGRLRAERFGLAGAVGADEKAGDGPGLVEGRDLAGSFVEEERVSAARFFEGDVGSGFLLGVGEATIAEGCR
jgi:hypothetical protein